MINDNSKQANSMQMTVRLNEINGNYGVSWDQQYTGRVKQHDACNMIQ